MTFTARQILPISWDTYSRSLQPPGKNSGSLRLSFGEMAQRGSCPRSLSSTSPNLYNSSRPGPSTRPLSQRHLWDELPAPSDCNLVRLPSQYSSSVANQPLDSWAKEMTSSVPSCCFGMICFMAIESWNMEVCRGCPGSLEEGHPTWDWGYLVRGDT